MATSTPIRRTVGRPVLIHTAGDPEAGSTLYAHITGIRTVYRLERKIIATDAGYEFNLTTGAQYPVGDARFTFAD